MAAAAVFQHQGTKGRLQGAVGDRFAGADVGQAWRRTARYLDGDAAFREQAVDHEAVADFQDVLAAEIANGDGAVLGGAPVDLVFGFFRTELIEQQPFFDIRQLQDFFDGVMADIGHHVLHQLVVGDGEFVLEAGHAGARVEQEIKQGPFFRGQDVFDRILGRLGMIDDVQKLLGNFRESFFFAVIGENNAGHARRRRIDDQVVLVADPFLFADMPVETEVGGLDIGKTRGYVVFTDGDPSRLNVAGIGEHNIADQSLFDQQSPGHDTIEIGAGYEPVFLI